MYYLQVQHHNPGHQTVQQDLDQRGPVAGQGAADTRARAGQQNIIVCWIKIFNAATTGWCWGGAGPERERDHVHGQSAERRRQRAEQRGRQQEAQQQRLRCVGSHYLSLVTVTDCSILPPSFLQISEGLKQFSDAFKTVAQGLSLTRPCLCP